MEATDLRLDAEPPAGPGPRPDAALRAALDGLLDELPLRSAAAAVERLITGYRSGTPGGTPVLRDRSDAAAYAAYRMPATFEAVRAALGAFRDRAGRWTPATHADIGGGTGAACWAAAATWPHGAPSGIVLDRSQAALDLGRDLAARSGHPALQAVQWRPAQLGGAPLPDCDLATVSYLLGELAEADRAALVEQVAAAAQAVVVVEPGTPGGHARVLAAREQLLRAGFTLLAPCPHGGQCPVREGDWCHFAARVSRSALHRRLKGAALPYEDEKFSYVAALRGAAAPAAGRVVRRPQLRKGQVLLQLCTPEGEQRSTVTKRHGGLYRAARDAAWGDPWPPAAEEPPD